MTDNKLRLAVISDIHYGPNNCTKIGLNAHELVSAFIEQVNAGDYDMVIELGDRITDIDKDTDRGNLLEVARLFNQLEVPCQHLLGNHDRVHLLSEENAEILQTDMQSTYLDTEVIRLIFWRPEVKIKKGLGFPSLSHDLEWLKETLGSTPNKAVIFNHVPISGHPQFGNYYFQNNFEHSTYPEYKKIRDLAIRHRATAAWISGHVHWNTFINIAGIPMFTIQSLTESFTTIPRPCGGWAEIEISLNSIDCKVNGLDPLFVSAPLIDRNVSPWHPPLGCFSKNDI